MTSNTINKLVLAGFKKGHHGTYIKHIRHLFFGQIEVCVNEWYISVFVGSAEEPVKQLQTTTTNVNKVLRQLDGL